MADNRRNYNETLAQQRKARAELVKLKQAQAGKIEMKNQTPLEAAMPKTAGEKIKNVWYHDKWVILGFIAVIALIVFMCVECAKKEKYDLEAVTFTYSYIMDDQLNVVVEELEKHCKDIDGNGEVNIMSVNCSYGKNTTSGASMQYTSSTKVQALLATDKQALLFITDAESYEFLNGVDEENPLFVGEGVLIPEYIYEKVKEKTGYELPEGLKLCYRRVNDTTLEKEKNVKEYYEQAKAIAEAIGAKVNE